MLPSAPPISSMMIGCPSEPLIRLPKKAARGMTDESAGVHRGSAGYDYNSGWISFCWRDSHPLEWQLASLHDQCETEAERGADQDRQQADRDRVARPGGQCQVIPKS